MNIAIIGGSGFLGSRLALHLLKTTDWNITIISRNPTLPLTATSDMKHRLIAKSADALDITSISNVLEDIDIVYYLIHSMGGKDKNFYLREEQSARSVHTAIQHSTVKRVIYMGGLGDDNDKLSQHLRSRHKTGVILRSLSIDVIEFRASMIIGKGSVAFDIIRNVADKLPIMTLPRSTDTPTQPIMLHDVLAYLYQAATLELDAANKQVIVEIGGPEVLSYAAIYKSYAKAMNKHRLTLYLPLLPNSLAAMFLNLFTPKTHARIGNAMMESLENEMTVQDHASAHVLFPSIHPKAVSTEIKHYAEDA